MSIEERCRVLELIRGVDMVIPAIDTDMTVNATIRTIHQLFGRIYNIVFANGGDVTNNNTREAQICKELGISLIDGVGGGKIKSSSKIIDTIKTRTKEILEKGE